jgi:hypothetical protein
VGHEQPALPSYFFHGGFVDLKDVIGGAFERCGETISKSKDGMGNAGGDLKDSYSNHGFWASVFWFFPLFLFKFGFYLMQFIASVIVTPLVCFSITVFQIAILLVLFLIGSIYFMFITLFDTMYCSINAIVSHCPNCQNKFGMPMYICPICGEEHDRLRPGFYGILNRRCNCGEKLPTTFMNGRQKLDAKCPHCKYSIKDGGLHASWCIPIVGGASSGKTCYVNMTMMSLEKNAHKKYGLQFEHEKNGLDEYDINATSLSQGHLPDKTQELQLRYYQFTLTPENMTKQQISLCDVAGELFDVVAGSNAINKQIGFKYVNAFMLIIDPLSIPDYRKEVEKNTDIKRYYGGAQRIDEMLDTFVRTLQNMFSVDAKAMLNTDVAVVFSKADIPGLNEKIGESAVFKKASNLSSSARYETQNRLCEDFLREYNEDNFLISLKSRFKSIQFFTCSALGHVENGQPFTPSNVEEPFFWLIRKKSSVIDKAIRARSGK